MVLPRLEGVAGTSISDNDLFEVRVAVSVSSYACVLPW